MAVYQFPMGESAAARVTALLDGFGALTLDDDFLSCFHKGDFTLAAEDFPQVLLLDETSAAGLAALARELRTMRQTKNESVLWESLRAQAVSPVAAAALAFGLVAAGSGLSSHGLIIYSILIGMEPLGAVWSPPLFNHILSALIAAQQILDGQPSDLDREPLDLAATLLTNLAAAACQPLFATMGKDATIALAEISVRLTTGIRPEFETVNTQIAEAAAAVIAKIAESQLPILLPFLVPALLLNFAAATTTLNARLERTRDRLVRVGLDHIAGDNEDYSTFCKHLIVRAPEKSHLRKSAVIVITKFAGAAKDSSGIINFVLRYAHSPKVTSRAFATQLLTNFLGEIDFLLRGSLKLVPEMTMAIASTLKKQVSDFAPTVRAAGLDGLTQMLRFVDDHICSDIIRRVLDLNDSFIKIVSKRIIDEKLIVRRAALYCLNEVVSRAGSYLPQVILELVSSRVYDRATSLRQQAVKVLRFAVNQFPDDNDLRFVWLDSILPLIVDPETSVQNEAFEAVRTEIFTPIEQGRPESFSMLFTQSHFDFMKNVFTLYKQKGVRLSGVAKGLVKRVISDSSQVAYWKLLDILTIVESSNVKWKKLIKLWGDHSALPAEYFSILAHLHCKQASLIKDSLNTLNAFLNANTSDYHMIDSILSFLRMQSDNDDISYPLIESCCSAINSRVQDDRSDQSDLQGILSQIYALGVLLSSVRSTRHLMDFDFSGIEVLLAEQLPNHVWIPSKVRSISAVTLGKLCLQCSDVARSNVSIFVHQLATSSDSPLKCNCLISLCDLCVRYSALVEDHVNMMTNCFVDESPNVRRQTLHILTKLVVEDYVKMRPLLFFKYVMAITDKVESVASFAQCCLFNVIVTKHPDLIYSNFTDCLYYFSKEIEMVGLEQTEDEVRLFTMSDDTRRRLALDILISKLRETGLFYLMEGIFKRILKRYLDDELQLGKQETILSDSIYSLIKIEERVKMTTEIEVLAEEANAEKVADFSKKLINDLHTKMIATILPLLNHVHRLLRVNHSPLQGQLSQFYKCIVEKNPALLNEVEKSEPLLASELREEMSHPAEVEESITPPTTPVRPQKFSSPLLSKIGSDPRTLSHSPSVNSQNVSTPKRSEVRREFSTPPHATELD
jgi:condensin-2 complex subunit D3